MHFVREWLGCNQNIYLIPLNPPEAMCEGFSWPLLRLYSFLISYCNNCSEQVAGKGRMRTFKQPERRVAAPFSWCFEGTRRQRTALCSPVTLSFNCLWAVKTGGGTSQQHLRTKMTYLAAIHKRVILMVRWGVYGFGFKSLEAIWHHSS